jgi:hypothetical protein
MNVIKSEVIKTYHIINGIFVIEYEVNSILRF